MQDGKARAQVLATITAITAAMMMHTIKCCNLSFAIFIVVYDLVYNAKVALTRRCVSLSFDLAKTPGLTVERSLGLLLSILPCEC